MMQLKPKAYVMCETANDIDASLYASYVSNAANVYLTYDL